MTTAGRRFVVEGLVQGVGYRVFARRSALALGLSGFAENRQDGSVLVEAHGPDDKLAALESALRSGPAYGRVDRVCVTQAEHETPQPNRFDIR